MGGIDLTAVRSAVASLMVDACTITRDAPGADDDVLDQGTGVLTAPNPDTTTIYSGACLIGPDANAPRPLSEGGVAIVSSAYIASIPYTAPVVEPGDVLTVTASRWDSALVGRKFTVRQALVASFNARRSLSLEARTPS